MDDIINKYSEKLNNINLIKSNNTPALSIKHARSNVGFRLGTLRREVPSVLDYCAETWPDCAKHILFPGLLP